METLKMTKLQTIIGYVWNDYELNEIEEEILETLENDFDEYEDAKGWLEDVVQHGGISGCIPNLVYHWQIKEFLDEHLWTVQDILYDMEMEGYGIYRFDTFDKMVWDVYEYCASHILCLMENAELDYIEEWEE